MTLLHPWAAIAGVAALGLPILIHLLTRPRPVRMSLSTVRFVKQAIQQRRTRHRLRDILILLLRTAAVCLLCWAFARPLLDRKPAVDPASPGDVIRIVVLDDGVSMSAISDASSAFDRARAEAAQFLPYQSGLRADVILAAARPHALLNTVTANMSALRDALPPLSPLPQRTDAQAAVNRAAELLASAPRSAGARTQVVIVSNFLRANWASVDFSPLPADVHIQLQSVAPAHPPDNLAILRISAAGRLEEGRDVRLEADIGNYSPTPRQVDVEIDLDKITAHLQGLCAPGVKTTLSAPVKLPAAGWLVGQARLVGIVDALAADNARPVALQVQPLPIYALITRDSPRPHVSSSHFIERALAPTFAQPGKTAETVIRLDPANLDRTAAGSASLLVLDHPGTLSEENLQYLAALIRRGKGMLYIAAEPQDAANLARLAQIAGSDLKMPVQFTPPLESQPRKNLFILEFRKDQSPFDQLGETVAALQGQLRFSRGLSSSHLPGGLDEDILATYSDRSACLIVTPCGAGQIAVLNADLTASNLPGSSLFAPMIEELCNRLLAAANSVDTHVDAQPCGDPMALVLPASCAPAKGLTIASSDAALSPDADLGALSDESTGVLWRADAAGPTAVYTVQRNNQTLYAIASAPPASQSDLETIDPTILTTRLAAGRQVDFQIAGDRPPGDRAWVWLLTACALCLIGELGLLKIFRT